MVLRLSEDARKLVLGSAAEEARRRGGRRLGTDHLLLGLLHDPDCAAARALQVDLTCARNALDALDRERCGPRHRLRRARPAAVVLRSAAPAATDLGCASGPQAHYYRGASDQKRPHRDAPLPAGPPCLPASRPGRRAPRRPGRRCRRCPRAPRTVGGVASLAAQGRRPERRLVNRRGVSYDVGRVSASTGVRTSIRRSCAASFRSSETTCTATRYASAAATSIAC